MCEKKKIQYKDDSFPAHRKSLIKDWNDESKDIQEKIEEWTDFKWMRASEIKELNDSDGRL